MSAYITQSKSDLVNNKPFNERERKEFINNHLKAIEENNPSAINSLANYYCYSELLLFDYSWQKNHWSKLNSISENLMCKDANIRKYHWLLSSYRKCFRG